MIPNQVDLLPFCDTPAAMRTLSPFCPVRMRFFYENIIINFLQYQRSVSRSLPIQDTGL